MTCEAENKGQYGLIGKNISYSLSPVIHNAAFAHFGVDSEYVIFDIGSEAELISFIKEKLLSGTIRGVNVTVPYKVIVRDFILKEDRSLLDESAGMMGAVNTVKCEEGFLTGFNTDAEGFYRSLVDETGYSEGGRPVIIYGAGGAGGAISTYLAATLKKEKAIYIYDKDKARQEDLAGHLLNGMGFKNISPVDEGYLAQATLESELIINATPLGTHKGDPMPVDPEFIDKDKVVYDIVYARETELVANAKKRGAKAVNGLGMLVNQAALAFNIWTGLSFDEAKKVMTDAAMRKISGEQG